MRRALGTDQRDTRALRLLAVGKAAAPMARAAVEVLGARVRGGLVVAPVPEAVPRPLELIIAEHPQPGPGSEHAGERALEVSAAVQVDEELLVLLSGGASSLLAAPAAGVTLADKRAATGILLRAGADIVALNTVRKHLSRVKGGRLAAACPSACRALVLSDVVGDPLGVIASGPTVPDESTFGDAWRVIEAFGGVDAYPPAVVAHLAAGVRGEVEESPKPGDPRLARVQTAVIGGRREAMAGAAEAAAALGYATEVIEAPVIGEARQAGERLTRAALARRRADGPVCVISSGETTVHVRGDGKGGRNQELALASAELMARAGHRVALASVGTDGIDGPTDAAGAIADGTTTARAGALGLADPGAYLARNDAYAYFDALGDLVRTGPTGTNVGDLQVFLLA